MLLRGHEAALLCYDCVLNTVHIYNSAPETTQGQAVEVAARGLGYVYVATGMIQL